jgi:hypothetical protein
VFLVLRNEWLTNGIYGINGIARPAFSLVDLWNFYFSASVRSQCCR